MGNYLNTMLLNCRSLSSGVNICFLVVFVLLVIIACFIEKSLKSIIGYLIILLVVVYVLFLAYADRYTDRVAFVTTPQTLSVMIDSSPIIGNTSFVVNDVRMDTILMDNVRYTNKKLLKPFILVDRVDYKAKYNILINNKYTDLINKQHVYLLMEVHR